jgi:hypothetical protein
MTIHDLQPGSTIGRIGEEIFIADKSQRKVGVRTITEFKVIRGCCKSGLWVTGQQVQQWLDTARFVENPLMD